MRPAVLRAYTLGVITGSMVTAGLSILAAPAKADVTDATVDRYASSVCAVLADYPSFDGIIGIGSALGDYGYTGYEAGQIVAAAVIGTCPEFIPLIKRFGAAYGNASHTTVA